VAMVADRVDPNTGTRGTRGDCGLHRLDACRENTTCSCAATCRIDLTRRLSAGAATGTEDRYNGREQQ